MSIPWGFPLLGEPEALSWSVTRCGRVWGFCQKETKQILVIILMGFRRRRLLQYDWFPYYCSIIITHDEVPLQKTARPGHRETSCWYRPNQNLGSKLNKCKMGSTARIFHINLGAHSWLLPAHKFMMVVFWPAFLGYDGCAMMNLLSWTWELVKFELVLVRS